jgi:cytochrome c
MGMQLLNAALVLVLGPLALASACGATDAKNGGTAAQSSPASFSEQVTRGTEVYVDHCSSCHGKSGEGTADAPAVVGATALPLDPPSGAKFRKSKFVTVADVAKFVTENMPGDAPGSLSADDYYAVLAFDLHANGIDLDSKLDAALAASLTIPRN